MRIGQKVTYIADNKFEYGIIKSISDEDHVFVVYNCNKDWDNYRDYTAARTRIVDLIEGWIYCKDRS